MPRPVRATQSAQAAEPKNRKFPRFVFAKGGFGELQGSITSRATSRDTLKLPFFDGATGTRIALNDRYLEATEVYLPFLARALVATGAKLVGPEPLPRS